MEVPPNTKTLDLDSSIIWFDNDGILCSISRKHPPQSLEELKATISQFKEFTKGQKVCLLSDSTNSTPPNKEVRDWAAEVLPEIVKAAAIVSKSAVGIMIANLFFSIKKQSYPVKLFDNETDAREWLKKYL